MFLSFLSHQTYITSTPDSKVHGPTWGPPGSWWPQIGPMLAPWTLLSGIWFIVWHIDTYTCRPMTTVNLHWRYHHRSNQDINQSVIHSGEDCQYLPSLSYLSNYRKMNYSKIFFYTFYELNEWKVSQWFLDFIYITILYKSQQWRWWGAVYS